MRIHKAGIIPISVIILLVLIILVIFNIIFPVNGVFHYILYGIAVVFVFLVIRFFRLPDRRVIADEQLIYSAADGNIVAIEEIDEKEYFNDRRLQVSVFMTLISVHVNFYPVSGKVKYVHHYPGRHHPAYTPKASLENEMTSIIIGDKNGREIMVRQIAGIMARRIVCKARVGLEVRQGEEIGIIKFGSRVDLILPLGVKMRATLHKSVKAGRDVIAEYPASH